MSFETTHVDVIPLLFCLLPSLCYIDVQSIESNAFAAWPAMWPIVVPAPHNDTLSLQHFIHMIINPGRTK